MCATTAGQNEFARDVVGNPCRPVPLIATNSDACTRFAEIVSRRTKSHRANSRRHRFEQVPLLSSTDSVFARVGGSTDSVSARVGGSADLMKMRHPKESELALCVHELVKC